MDFTEYGDSGENREKEPQQAPIFTPRGGFRVSNEIYERTVGAKKDTAGSKAAAKLSPEMFRQIEEDVITKMTAPSASATPEETAARNEMLARCVIGDKAAQNNTRQEIMKFVEATGAVMRGPQLNAVVDRIYKENYGLGAIEDYVNDESLNEINVDSFDSIWYEKGGRRTRIKAAFRDDEDVMRIIRLLLQYNHKDISQQHPSAEAFLMDGSRITIIIPPESSHPTICIRKFSAFDVDTDNYIRTGSISQEIADFTEVITRGRTNVMVIGETGSGKTSFLKWMVGCMSPELRIGTIETNFELRLKEKYPERSIVEYQECPELGITMSDLFKKMLRSTPDIIICGEARSFEMDELIRAMRRGHPGSVGTMHTNSPETMVSDAAEMINEDGQRRDPVRLEYRIASAVQLIYQMRRCDDGVRRIVRISQIVTETDPNGATESGKFGYRIEDIFRYEFTSLDQSGGKFVKVGHLSQQLRDSLVYHGVPKETAAEL